MAEFILTDTESQVLYALTRYPNSPNTELYESLGMRRSTFSSIKSRLLQRNAFRTVRLPNPYHIGCELLVASWASYARPNIASIAEGAFDYLKDHHDEGFDPSQITLDQALQDVAAEALELFRITFHSVLEEFSGLGMSMARDFSQFQEHYDRILSLNKKYGAIDSPSIRNVLFSLKQSELYNFFDYSHVLALLFEIEEQPHATTGEILTTEPRKFTGIHDLSEKEKSVLLGLVRFPSASDEKVAQIAGVSRGTVTRTRQRLEDDGTLWVRVIPNMSVLGLEIMMFWHTQFPPEFSLSERKEILRSYFDKLPHIFLISSTYESMGLSVFQNFHEFHRIGSFFSKVIMEAGIAPLNPQVHVMSVEGMKTIRDLDFEPLMEFLLSSKK